MMISLVEAAPPIDVLMPRLVALQLADLKIATVTPTLIDEVWRVSAVQRVGVVSISGHEVRISPKLPIKRLFFMMGYANGRRIWRDEDAQLDSDTDVLATVARVFIRRMRQAIAQGLLQGYVSIHESQSVVRGRIDFDEQLKRRPGIASPMAVAYDEFTVDIQENRMLAAAVGRLLRLPQIDVDSRRLLKRYEMVFQGVSLLQPGTPVGNVRFDRRNEHYRPAYELAALIVSGSSLEHRFGTTSASGFLMNVADVYEDFLGAAIKEALERTNGGTVSLQLRGYLDAASRLRIKPDIAWSTNGKVAAIVDAKYKAQKPAGYPNADVYQMLAYCSRYSLHEGHLVYAAGEEEPAIHSILGSGIRVHCHALNLDCSPPVLIDRVNALAARIAEGARADPEPGSLSAIVPQPIATI